MRMARNIYHRKDGRFEGRYANGYDENGKTKYSSVFDRTYTACKEKLEQAKLKVAAAGQSPPNSKETVRDAVTAYLNTAKSQLKPSTIGIYQRYLDKYISPHFGNTLRSDLSTEISQGFVNKLIENGLSVKTVQSVFSLLKAGVSSTANEAFKVKMPKTPQRSVDFFTVDEQKQVEKAAKSSGHVDYNAIMLCLYTGIRIGEVCGLQFEDIDFTAGTLRVNRTMQRIPNSSGATKTTIAFLSPKSVASERVIPLPDFLLPLLLESKTASTCDYVLSLDGRPLEPRTLQYRFKKICSAANVKEVNFHTTRHSFAVRALENGFDVKSLSEIMGHANATVTLNLYAHATDTRKRSCMNALSAIYSKD